MVKRTKWVERKFDFNFPIGLFPCIVERVRGTPARIQELVQNVPENILTARVNGKWSVQEHIGHLLDLEELHEGRLDDYLSGAKVLRPADITNKKTTEANHNAKSIRSILNDFRIARKRFVERLEQMDEETLARSALHPRLQQAMRLVDFAFFVAEHDDHHLASMNELLNVLRT